MKTYDYLKTGFLEAHLLGLTTQQERDELERLLRTDADVRAELNELEIDLEAYLLRQAVPPPPSVREAIELRISETDLKKWEAPTNRQSGSTATNFQSTEPSYINVEVNNTHIQVHKHWRTAFIAVFVLSKVFLVLGLYYYFKSGSQEQEIMRLKTEMQQSVSPGSLKP